MVKGGIGDRLKPNFSLDWLQRVSRPPNRGVDANVPRLHFALQQAGRARLARRSSAGRTCLAGRRPVAWQCSHRGGPIFANGHPTRRSAANINRMFAIAMLCDRRACSRDPVVGSGDAPGASRALHRARFIDVLAESGRSPLAIRQKKFALKWRITIFIIFILGVESEKHAPAFVRITMIYEGLIIFPHAASDPIEPGAPQSG